MRNEKSYIRGDMHPSSAKFLTPLQCRVRLLPNQRFVAARCRVALPLRRRSAMAILDWPPGLMQRFRPASIRSRRKFPARANDD